MNKRITLRTSPKNIFKTFRECKDTESVNLILPNGFIYLVGGILNKLEGNDHYIAIKNRWVLI